MDRLQARGHRKPTPARERTTILRVIMRRSLKLPAGVAASRCSMSRGCRTAAANVTAPLTRISASSSVGRQMRRPTICNTAALTRRLCELRAHRHLSAATAMISSRSDSAHISFDCGELQGHQGRAGPVWPIGDPKLPGLTGPERRPPFHGSRGGSTPSVCRSATRAISKATPMTRVASESNLKP
jgi:hypothetical protein